MKPRQYIKLIALALSITICTNAKPAALNISDSPLYIGANIPPLVMMNISKDQQLYKKAYNDYSDIDGDGTIETTYNHAINYYGYFDSTKCYNYSTSNNRFEPIAVSSTKYCDGVSGGRWSGNFLNWVAMSRMDAVRKLLYGGMRSTDSSTGTVLERAYLPTDAHSWVKYYNGSDISKLTPYNPATTSPTGTISGANGSYAAATVTLGTGTKQFISGSASVCLGDQLKVYLTSTPASYMLGYVSTIRTGGTNYSTGNTQNCATSFEITVDASGGGVVGSGSGTAWTFENLSQTGISFCNTTIGADTGANKLSHTNTNTPLIRVALGNFSLWTANERWQCYWKEESRSTSGTAAFGGARSNGNVYSLSGVTASAFEPVRATHGQTPYDFVARVQACVSTLLGAEKCKEYPGGNFKPIGLLQVYGDTGLLKFGLMTGTYVKNISGGVLRKNIRDFSDEVNTTTDGTFKATPATGGIVNTLNKMRIFGYDYSDGTYLDATGDNCTFQLTNITEGSCTSWGNPMSEIYYESLRYLAGKTVTTAYNADDTGKIAGLTTATWSDPLSSSNYCAALNVLNFNASVSTNDYDLAATTLGDLGKAGESVSSWADKIGVVAASPNTSDNINGNSYFIGRSGAGTNELCDSKTVTGLGSIAGICPEGPTLLGSYLMPGLAYLAHTNKIRTDITVPTTDYKSLKVTTYGISLATNVPQIVVPVPGSTTGQKVIIQPAYRLDTGTGFGGGALVDLKLVSQSSTSTTATGRVYITWEDSEQGGDYDQDMWGVLTYTLNTATNSIAVTTNSIAASTANGQGFGYVITGTTKDGPHFHSGILGFNYTDPLGVTGCTNCNVGDAPTTVTYTLGASTAANLQDPLWYTAKWGGFKELRNTDGTLQTNGDKPYTTAQWDIKTTTGTIGADGTPDNYFLVSNANGLESALDKTFTAILATSSAASVATNSSSLKTGSKVYQARFNSNDWSGQLLALPISLTGVVADSSAADWDAGQVINTQSATSRVILAYNPTLATPDGIAFRWSNLSTAQQTTLNGGDSRGSQRLDYLRGDATNEGGGSTDFRKRSTSKLGDIVDSNPSYVAAIPSAGYFDSAYSTFRAGFVTTPRAAMLYTGANDGMLHGFDAATGQEKIAYIPNKVFANLPLLTSQGYGTTIGHKYFVDGSPTVEDAQISGTWKTVLVGGLGKGGQGYYALDVTNPTNFTEANAASLVLWEFTDAHDRDLGYSFSVPVIKKMANGKWAAIFGNGYNNSEADGNASTTGRAALFIVFLQEGVDGTWTSGTDYIKIVTSVGSTGTPNGLATPATLDTQGDDVVDYIYAGDLQGNMWKFDVTNTTPSSWAIAFSGTPLYTAQDASNNPQPITSKPEIALHPNGGYLIAFGTGKYLGTTDTTGPHSAQTLYGIWDNAAAVSGNRTNLQQQTVLGFVTVGTDQYPITSTTAVNYPTKKGWYMDFYNSATTGERDVFSPILDTGIITFTSVVPPASTNLCDPGTSFFYDLDVITGGRLAESPYDVNNDGVINSSDTVVFGGVNVVVSGRKSKIGITPTPTIIGAGGDSKYQVTSGSTGGTESVLKNVPGSSGRVTWREILND